MKTINKIVLVSISLVFAASLGCGSSNINGDKKDTSTVSSPKDARPDLTVNSDIDAGVVSGPEVAIDLPTTSGTDAVITSEGCVGLSPEACHLSIINPPADPSIMAQDVPGPVPPSYLTCISQ